MVQAPAPDSRLGPGAALGIGVVALAVRLGHVAWCAAHELFRGLFLDARFFAWTAASIRAGEGAGDHPYLLSPLYPYFLALFPGVSAPPDTAALLGPRLVQAVAGAGTCVLAACAAARLATRRAGFLAGLCAALLGQLVHYDAGILVASLSATALSGALVLLVRGGEVARPRAALGAGVLLGLAAALRPTALLVAVASSSLWLVDAARRRPGAARAALALGGGTLLAVLPFAARNLLVTGEPVLLSASGGFNFWVGNHAGADGTWETPEGYDAYRDPLARRLVASELGHEPSWREASAWWRARALRDVASEPLAWARLLGRKLFLFFHPGEIPQLGFGFPWYRERSPFLRLPLDPLWLLLLGLGAPLAARAAGRVARLRWPLAFLAAHAVGVTAFFVTGRYRAPILPVAVVLAAVGADALVAALAGARRRAGLVGLGAFLALGAGLHVAYARLAPLAEDTGLEDLQRAVALAHGGRAAEAVAAFPDVLARLDLDSGRAAYGDALRALGRTGEAREQYRTIVERHPRNALAWHNLGILLWEDFGDAAGAERALGRALEVEPDLAAARYDLGAVLLVQGRVDEAEEHLRRALAAPVSDDPGGGAAPEEWRAEARRLLDEIARYRRESGH